MIYISTSCIKSKKISHSVQALAECGYRNIELSGGTEFYEGYLEDLLKLQDKYSLNYLCHNYFPPPKNHFVLNLASSNEELFKRSMDHFYSVIDLSKKLGSKQFAMHAGFLLDIKVSEIGKTLSRVKTADYKEAVERFFSAYKNLSDATEGKLKLYIENNVFSNANYEAYKGINPLMLTHAEEYQELQAKYDFNLLLDVAHLKVSCKTLGRDFNKDLTTLIKSADYLHISDNDGLADSNMPVEMESSLLKSLRQNRPHIVNKIMTVEVYNGIEGINKTVANLEKLINE